MEATSLEALDASPLSVPLQEPFVIATGVLSETRSVLVRVVLRRGPTSAVGLGEGAALPPVTSSDQPELLQGAREVGAALIGQTFRTPTDLAERLADAVCDPALRAGVETAILDAWGKLDGRPCFDLLDTNLEASRSFVTDITIPIGTPAHMAALAERHHRLGFSTFKVKVGRDLASDVAALSAIAAAAPDARLRVDANGGYDLPAARAFLRATERFPIECFEQPCARGREEEMGLLARETHVPLVADESLRSRSDLAVILHTRCASAVNLKLAKLGSLIEAAAVGRLAREAGLDLMVGAMVETRLGLTAMMHVAAALGGARFVDLDTQLLLTEERFEGGYRGTGPEMSLTGGAGLDLVDRVPAMSAPRSTA